MIGAKVRDKCLRSFYNSRETSIQTFRYPNKFQEKYRKKYISTHIVVKLHNTQTKIKILKALGEKRNIIYKGQRY